MKGARERTRALARVSVAAALGRDARLAGEIRKALTAQVPVRDLDEILLQIIPFAGYARAINAFAVLQEIAPHRPPPARRERNLRGRGEALCRRIYGRVYGRLMKRIRGYHPQLAEWILSDGYGRVLARPDLSVVERELAIVAVLTALRLPKQLESHLSGARRVGASEEALKDALAAGGFRSPAVPSGSKPGPGSSRRRSPSPPG